MVRRALHLFGLTSVAIAAPLLIAVDAQFFIGRGATPQDVVVIVLVIAIGVPLVLIVVELLARLASERLAAAIHLVFVGILAGLLFAELLRTFELPVFLHLALGVAAGVGGAVAYSRYESVRSIATVLSPAPVVVVAFVLLASPVAPLVFSGEGEVELAAADADVRAPVVVVALDEFAGYALMDERGRIDRERFPNFARFAGDATWFPNATTSRSDTELAQPTIVSGRDAPLDTLPIAADHPQSLFTLLGSSHRMNVSEPWTDLCPESACPESSTSSFGDRVGPILTTMPAILGHLSIPDADELGLPRPRESSAPDRSVQFREWAEGIERGTEPSLDYLHVLLPHKPWRYLPSGRSYPDDVGRDAWLGGLVEWGEDPFTIRQFNQRYLLQVGYVDRLLGELMRRLREIGIYDDAMVVVVADHGASFRLDEPRREPTEANLADIMSVPLFVKAPGQEKGEVDRRAARTRDVLPTIADGIGAELPWELDGVSLLGPPPEPADLEIENIKGEEFAVSLAEFERMRDEALESQVEIFGSGRTGIYDIGPSGELIGSAPRRYEESETDAGATIVDGGALRDFDPDSSTVPVRVAGVLDGLEAGDPLAVALNGRIVATSQGYDGERGVEFAAMYPQDVLRPGENKLALYAIEESSEGSPALAELGIEWE